ncbi:MAG: hypothetical protein WBZ14_14240 [Terriglobales bacterium]|jgi:hypothetical protein
MSIRRCLILLWLLAGFQGVSLGQDQPSQNPPTQGSGDDSASDRTAPAPALSAVVGMQEEGGTEDTTGDLPRIPALLGGQGTSSAFLSEMKRSNFLRGGVNVSATYDDNPLLLSSGAQSNTSVSIFPNIKIEESSSRMRWTLGYAGGLTINQSLASENQDSQSLNFDSQYRLSPHVNLRVAENFSMITGFFDAGNGADIVAGPGGPNASLITPLSTQRSSVTTVEGNYHFALNDLVGASGSFYDLNFSNVPAGTQLTDSQTASGTAFWLHRIFGEDWSGLSYHFDRITYNPGSSETQVHSFRVVNTLSLWKRLTLTGFIGPQYSENQGLVTGATQPSQSSGWSVSGGAEGGWQGARTSMSAGYTRSISDGGGVLGAVHLQTVHGAFRRVLVPGWTVAITASHGTNQSITVPFTTSASSINSTSAGISLGRNVGKSVGLGLGYTHNFQEQFGVPGPTLTSPPQTLDANQNRFFVTFSYQWAKPLGM